MPALDIDSEVLIDLVKSRPMLWDKTSEIYKDKNATKNAWEEVCILLNKNFPTLEEKDQKKFTKEVFRRWTNVRDSFAKFLRKEREVKNGALASKTKKYIYHNQMRFLRKLYGAENVEENTEEVSEDDAPRINTETFITKVYPRTRSQNTETVSDADDQDNLTSAETASTTSQLSKSVFNKRKRLDESELKTSDALYEALVTKEYPRTRSKDIERVSDAGDEDNLTSTETASITSQLSGSDFNKRKRLDESEFKTSKVLHGEKSDRHLSFFKGIIPSVEEFNEQEVLKFQMGVLQLISNIKDQRHRASHAQLPAQLFSFPSQPGPSSYLPPIAASYPSGQPIFPTFWSPVCSKCSCESTPRESSSNPVD